jgi:hypothetical protein
MDTAFVCIVAQEEIAFQLLNCKQSPTIAQKLSNPGTNWDDVAYTLFQLGNLTPNTATEPPPPPPRDPSLPLTFEELWYDADNEIEVTASSRASAIDAMTSRILLVCHSFTHCSTCMNSYNTHVKGSCWWLMVDLLLCSGWGGEESCSRFEDTSHVESCGDTDLPCRLEEYARSSLFPNWCHSVL